MGAVGLERGKAERMRKHMKRGGRRMLEDDAWDAMYKYVREQGWDYDWKLYDVMTFSE